MGYYVVSHLRKYIKNTNLPNHLDHNRHECRFFYRTNPAYWAKNGHGLDVKIVDFDGYLRVKTLWTRADD